MAQEPGSPMDDLTRDSLAVGDFERSHEEEEEEDEEAAKDHSRRAAQTQNDISKQELLGLVQQLQTEVKLLRGASRRLSDVSSSAYDYSNHGNGVNTSSNHGNANGNANGIPNNYSDPISPLSGHHSIQSALHPKVDSEFERKKREKQLEEKQMKKQIEKGDLRWGELHKRHEETYMHTIKHDDHVFMHPEQVNRRIYSPEEVAKIRYRPFPSRLFITDIQLEGNTVWLRTRHTDHHAHKSCFIQVRDALKADAITYNPKGAKYALTELINMCCGMEESDYYSFACTLASAFSNKAANTEFEKGLLLPNERKKAMAIDERKKAMDIERRDADQDSTTILPDTQRELKLLLEKQDRARVLLLQLMDIVFSKLKQKKLLVDDSKGNIYRLVLCMTKHNRSRWPRLPFLYAGFSFFFQLCASTYVALSMSRPADLWRQTLALAIGTVCYGMMVAYPEMNSTLEVRRYLFRPNMSPLASKENASAFTLATMDFIVNFFLPFFGAIFGFFVVFQAGSYLEGVLNAVALIFITEIDDHVPRLLGLDTLDIVQGFLIDQAMAEYRTQDLAIEITPPEFSDIHVTNTEESGSVPSKGVTFQPYEVFGTPATAERQVSGLNFRSGDMGQQVANKRYVTAHCLLRKIKWQYTNYKDGKTSLPRVGHLKLCKLLDGEEIEYQGIHSAPQNPWFSITGVYIITSFCMSDDVLRLRVCGSREAPDFLEAFKYYSLWPLERSALNLLKTAKDHRKPEQIVEDDKENDEVLKGQERPVEVTVIGRGRWPPSKQEPPGVVLVPDWEAARQNPGV